MAKKTKADSKRTKVKALPKSKQELTGKDMRKVKGGTATLLTPHAQFTQATALGGGGESKGKEIVSLQPAQNSN